MQKRRTDKAVLIYICLAAFLILCIVKFDAIILGAGRLWNVILPLVLGMSREDSRHFIDGVKKAVPVTSL